MYARQPDPLLPRAGDVIPPVLRLTVTVLFRRLGNELQKQSRDQIKAIKPSDWSVWSRAASASCKPGGVGQGQLLLSQLFRLP